MGLFNENTIELNLKAKSKVEVIDELIELLEKDGVINDKTEYKKAILKREKESSTGIGFGIAIPHAKTNAVNFPRVAVGISKDGVDFESSDNSLANLIFMIAVPDGTDNEHLKILAQLSRKLIDPVFRNKLMEAVSENEIMEYLAEIQ